MGLGGPATGGTCSAGTASSIGSGTTLSTGANESCTPVVVDSDVGAVFVFVIEAMLVILSCVVSVVVMAGESPTVVTANPPLERD